MSEARLQNATFYWLASFWPAILLVGFASAKIPMAPILGYRWSVELAVGAFLLATACLLIMNRRDDITNLSSRCEMRLILLPLSLFILWSFLSVGWSTSWRGALHHSLLWSCYLAFFLMVRHAVRDNGAKASMLKVVGATVFVISLACVIEYVTQTPVANKVFNERYYSYAEVIITVLPIFVACGIRADRKWSRLTLLVSGLSWAAVLATTSRAMFISGIIGLVTFVLLTLLIRREIENRTRWIVGFISLSMVSFVVLLSSGPTDHTTVVQRLSGGEEFSVKSAKSRLLLWGLAVEGFKNKPATGIGADNYFAQYKTLRESLSARNSNNAVLEITEDVIPERAHSEYLQILAELGIIGAILFTWLLVGVAYLFWLAYKKKSSLVTIGALSGIVAFLVASGASSYSFRFPANGLCFFFLLALVSRELFDSHESTRNIKSRRSFTLVPVFGVLVSLAMIAFCAVRANSIRHLTNAINAKDERVRTIEIENAIGIDRSEPMFHFYYGQWLQEAGDSDAAITHMRIAINNGLADSTSFYRLAGAEQGAGRQNAAQVTFVEALRVYPRSVFLRTAYAAFLSQMGDAAGAEVELGIAFSIDDRQARSWRIAHEEGLVRLVQTARADAKFVEPANLKPESAVLAVAGSQQRLSSHGK